MMNWILLVMAAVAAIVVAMIVGGLMAPRTRVATRTLDCDASASDVYRLLREADGPPRWFAALPTMHVQDESAPDRVHFALLNDDGTPMGTWIVTVHSEQERVVATITEQVDVDNVLLRFLRSFGGDGARPRAFLEAVAGQLGVAARIGDPSASP
jgi:uncharacterized protein YndB with AHSA1/START domain